MYYRIFPIRILLNIAYFSFFFNEQQKSKTSTVLLLLLLLLIFQVLFFFQFCHSSVNFYFMNFQNRELPSVNSGYTKIKTRSKQAHKQQIYTIFFSRNIRNNMSYEKSLPPSFSLSLFHLCRLLLENNSIDSSYKINSIISLIEIN